MIMKDILVKLNLEISDLASRFGYSRPTVYKYIGLYQDHNYESIPKDIKDFFDYISDESNQMPDKISQYLSTHFPNELESKTFKSDTSLQEIISKFCLIQKDSNFFSLVLPTGARKTSSIVRFISKYISEGGENRIFFVTTLKKNLPYNEDPAENQLRRGFEEFGIGQLYDEKVMMVDSLRNMLRNNYAALSVLDKRYLADKMGNNTVNTLRTYLDSLNALNPSNPLYNEINERFAEFESSFRGSLVKKLNTITRDPERKKILVTKTKDWSWVSKIYPTVFTDDRQVFLMSMDKFVSIHDTIVSGRYSFYDSKLMENAFVFIDEFDATKETVLKSIIEYDQDDVDYIGIFRRIYRTLEHNSDIWTEYYRIPGDNPESDIGPKMSEFYDRVVQIAKYYNLDCDFKLADTEQVTYIFRDNRIIKTGGNKEFYIDYDKENRINIVRSIDRGDGSNKKLPSGTRTIASMLGRMYNLFRWFESLMFKLAMNHMKVAEQNGRPISRDSAIKTILDPYDFNDRQIGYLVDAIKYRPPKRKNDDTPGIDISFYEMGFEMFNFVDGDDHNLSTKIYCTSIKRTPEKMLLRVLSQPGVRVVGISATARIDSVIGNYDFRYLKSQPMFKEYRIDDADRIVMKDAFFLAIDRYSEVNIHTDRLSGRSSAADLIKDKRCSVDADFFFDRFESNPFVRFRYGRILEAYRNFLYHPDIRSMLCFMNVFPKNPNWSGSDEFSHEFLTKTMTQMAFEYAESIKDKESEDYQCAIKLLEEPFIVLRSLDYDSYKLAVLNRLAKGERIFIMTTYATVGAGQNLQYRIPASVQDNIRYISSLADKDSIQYKDFDAIYLDRPTNIYANVSEADKSSLLNAIFAIESLQENHETDSLHSRMAIEGAFNDYYGVPHTHFSDSNLTKPSYRMAYIRKIIQAVGRICRTFAKNRDIYIFADDSLGEVFNGTSLRDFTDPNDDERDPQLMMLNPEFKALYMKLKDTISDRVVVEGRTVDNESFKTLQYINSIIRHDSWSEYDIKNWEALREFVLRYPTLPKDSKAGFAYDMYSTIPKGDSVRYDQKDDYGSVYLTKEGKNEVSAKDAHLDDLLKIHSVSCLFGPPKRLEIDECPTFEEMDSVPYADSFLENTAIMCPTLYHNIYKGALGEVAGKAIFADWDIPLCPITDPAKYEKFDFVSPSGVYIDFKHWAGTGSMDDIKLVRDSFKKLLKIHGSKAIIVNILKGTQSGSDDMLRLKGEDYSYDDDGIFFDFSGLELVIIPYLYDCSSGTAIENLHSRTRICDEVIL